MGRKKLGNSKSQEVTRKQFSVHNKGSTYQWRGSKGKMLKLETRIK